MIRGILFDKDGTLVDFERTWRPCYDACALAAADGDPALARELLELAGQGADGHIGPTSVLACGTLEQVWDLWQERIPVDRAALNRCADANLEPVALTDVPALFARLAHLHLGIATMDSTFQARRLVELWSLDVVFCTGFDGGHGEKPGPGMVLGFCAATGLDPSEVAVVGDTLHDMHMARAAGAVAVAVATGASPRKLLEPRADIVLDELDDLVDAVRDMKRT
ncbi:MAG: HAD family hydrolase [Proteobacteria bacterium]|nr:HAD family hydrolase [Pseudomonadota bacterium]MCP4921078.1 HAD family hydrolase [Pseudomonadota bacterium]